MQSTTAIATAFVALLALTGCSTEAELPQPSESEFAVMVDDCMTVVAETIGNDEADRFFDADAATITGYQEPRTWDIEIPGGGPGDAVCNWTSAVATVDFR